MYNRYFRSLQQPKKICPPSQSPAPSTKAKYKPTARPSCPPPDSHSKLYLHSSHSFKIWGQSLPKAKKLKSGLNPAAMHDVPVPRHREVRAFEAEALQPINAEITGLQYIGSYSWVKASTPTIAVPGTPRRWVDKPLPITLKADDVATFVDSNGHRAPSAPLLPLFLAVDATMNTSASASATSTSTQVEWPSIDVITDRNGLRKLLGWTTGSSRRKEWRIDMQLVGTKTVLFNRREPSTAVAPMPGGATFGHAFEMKMTKPQAKGVGRELDGHHRIVRYDFGGLCMVVRFEVDAFIPESSLSSSLSTTTPSKIRTPGANTARSPHPSTPQREKSIIKVINDGVPVSQSRILELKTCPLANAMRTKNKAYPQLFFSQTPHLYIGKHVKGCFSEITKNDVSAGDFNKQHDILVRSGALKKVVVALRNIQEIVRKSGKEGNLTLVFEKKALKVYERVTQKGASIEPLPKEIVARFEGGLDRLK